MGHGLSTQPWPLPQSAIPLCKLIIQTKHSTYEPSTSCSKQNVKSKLSNVQSLNGMKCSFSIGGSYTRAERLCFIDILERNWSDYRAYILFFCIWMISCVRLCFTVWLEQKSRLQSKLPITPMQKEQTVYVDIKMLTVELFYSHDDDETREW